MLTGSLALATLTVAGCSANSSDEQDPNTLATSLVTAAWETAVAANGEEFAARAGPPAGRPARQGPTATAAELTSSR